MHEYLLSYGTAGDLGRFRAPGDLLCRRGETLVVHSQRGLEMGTVLCASSEGHARLLKSVSVGEIVRRVLPEDRRTAEQLRRRGQSLFSDARDLAQEIELPLEILDVEMLLDGRQAILHYLKAAEVDPRELLDRLSERHQLLVSLRDLALPAETNTEEEEQSCGSGQCGSGGCGSCSSGNCSTCKHSTPQVAPEPAHRVALFST